MNFRPLQDFDCAELKSHYHKGLLYTVRPGNWLLQGYVEAWVKAGMVEVLAGPDIEVSGQGAISDA